MDSVLSVQAMRVYVDAFRHYCRRSVPDNWMRELALSKINEAEELLEQAMNTMKVVVVESVDRESC